VDLTGGGPVHLYPLLLMRRGMTPGSMYYDPAAVPSYIDHKIKILIQDHQSPLRVPRSAPTHTIGSAVMAIGHGGGHAWYHQVCSLRVVVPHHESVDQGLGAIPQTLVMVATTVCSQELLIQRKWCQWLKLNSTTLILSLSNNNKNLWTP
jgi:hypothetical protein